MPTYAAAARTPSWPMRVLNLRFILRPMRCARSPFRQKCAASSGSVKSVFCRARGRSAKPATGECNNADNYPDLSRSPYY